MFRYREYFNLAKSMTIMFSVLMLYQCGPSQKEFAVKHIRDETGEQITETVSFQTNEGLDNSDGTSPLQVQIQFERPYHYQIKEQLNNEEISTQNVREKIVELYKLPPNDPEGAQQMALCPLSIVIPAGQKAIITVEWTERWAEGVINEGVEGEGNQLGTYEVFLGYIEPCSLVEQENVQ